MIREQSKKNTDEPFVMEKVYDSSVEKVWSALTEKDAMKDWYFPQILAFEPVVGFEFQFVVDGPPYQKDWQVTRVETGRTLAHSWAYKGYPGYSEVIFELSGYGDQTRLKLTHTGLASFPDEAHFARKRFEHGWTNLLGHNLKRYLVDHRSDHSKA